MTTSVQRVAAPGSHPLEARPKAASGPSARRNRVGLLFVAPAVLTLTAFVLAPLVGAVALSFTRWSLLGTPTPVGLDNYRQLAQDGQFKGALIVTLEVAVGLAVPTTLLALALAVVLNSTRRGSDAYQSLLFLPAVLPSVVTSIVWGALFQRQGVANQVLGLDISWLTDSRWALFALVLLMIWTNLGYYTVVVLTGVRDVPPDILEAASVDGAGAWRRFVSITLPLIRPVLLFVAVIATADAFALFAQPFLLTGGGPGDATRTVSELIYETAFQFTDIGRASAMAVVLLVIVSTVAAVQFRLLRHGRD